MNKEGAKEREKNIGMNFFVTLFSANNITVPHKDNPVEGKTISLRKKI